MESRKVCVGVPLYNEELHVRETIRSLKEQTLDDAVFVLSDNCSNDATYSICEEEIASDSRFLLIRQPENIGAVANYKFLLDFTASKYFMWLGGHDCISQDLLTEAVAILDSDSDVSMVSGTPRGIFPDGRRDVITPEAIYDFNEDLALYRYLKSIAILVNCTCYQSLFRKHLLNEFDFRKTISQDHIIISRLLWFGKLKYLQNSFYERRYFEERSTTASERISGNPESLFRYSFYQYYLDDFDLLYQGDERIRRVLHGKIMNILESRFGINGLMPRDGTI